MFEGFVSFQQQWAAYNECKTFWKFNTLELLRQQAAVF